MEIKRNSPIFPIAASVNDLEPFEADESFRCINNIFLSPEYFQVCQVISENRDHWKNLILLKFSQVESLTFFHRHRNLQWIASDYP